MLFIIQNGSLLCVLRVVLKARGYARKPKHLLTLDVQIISFLLSLREVRFLLIQQQNVIPKHSSTLLEAKSYWLQASTKWGVMQPLSRLLLGCSIFVLMHYGRGMNENKGAKDGCG